MKDNTLDLYLLQEPHHEPHIRSFLEYHESEYQGVKLIGPEEDIDPVTSRNIGLWVGFSIFIIIKKVHFNSLMTISNSIEFVIAQKASLCLLFH